MASRSLPAPVTPTDELLVAVHTELVGLRVDLAAARRGGDRPTLADDLLMAVHHELVGLRSDVAPAVRAAEPMLRRDEVQDVPDVEVREPAPPKRRPRR